MSHLTTASGEWLAIGRQKSHVHSNCSLHSTKASDHVVLGTNPGNLHYTTLPLMTEATPVIDMLGILTLLIGVYLLADEIPMFGRIRTMGFQTLEKEHEMDNRVFNEHLANIETMFPGLKRFRLHLMVLPL